MRQAVIAIIVMIGTTVMATATGAIILRVTAAFTTARSIVTVATVTTSLTCAPDIPFFADWSASCTCENGRVVVGPFLAERSLTLVCFFGVQYFRINEAQVSPTAQMHFFTEHTVIWAFLTAFAPELLCCQACLLHWLRPRGGALLSSLECLFCRAMKRPSLFHTGCALQLWRVELGRVASGRRRCGRPNWSGHRQPVGSSWLRLLGPWCFSFFLGPYPILTHAIIAPDSSFVLSKAWQHGCEAGRAKACSLVGSLTRSFLDHI